VSGFTTQYVLNVDFDKKSLFDDKQNMLRCKFYF